MLAQDRRTFEPIRKDRRYIAAKGCALNLVAWTERSETWIEPIGYIECEQLSLRICKHGS